MEAAALPHFPFPARKIILGVVLLQNIGSEKAEERKFSRRKNWGLT